MNNFTNDMDDLLIRYLADEVSGTELQQVKHWIAASAENRVHFEQLRRIWEGSAELAPVVQVDEEQAWQRFQQRVHPPAKVVPINRTAVSRKVAASILLVVGAALTGYLFIFKPASTPKTLAVVTTTLVRADTLPDGSVATLNKYSSISYPSKFKGTTRPVKLEGEAFFKVTPDKEKPFIIKVNEVEVKVVGTAFNVKSSSGNTEIIVESGIVQVISGGKLVELKAGERVMVAKDSVENKVVSDDKLYNYYVSRTFICDNTPLWKLVDKLNEAYESKIIISDPRLRKLPLNVTFNEESLDMILKVVSQTLLVQVSKEDGQIIIH
ncbi:MAG: FecR domain-containing protein [Chitinophagaceae bacterium]